MHQMLRMLWCRIYRLHDRPDILKFRSGVLHWHCCAYIVSLLMPKPTQGLNSVIPWELPRLSWQSLQSAWMDGDLCSYFIWFSWHLTTYGSPHPINHIGIRVNRFFWNNHVGNLGAWGLALWEKGAGRLVLPVQGVQNEIFRPSNFWDACFGITYRLGPPRDWPWTLQLLALVSTLQLFLFLFPYWERVKLWTWLKGKVLSPSPMFRVGFLQLTWSCQERIHYICVCSVGCNLGVTMAFRLRERSDLVPPTKWSKATLLLWPVVELGHLHWSTLSVEPWALKLGSLPWWNVEFSLSVEWSKVDCCEPSLKRNFPHVVRPVLYSIGWNPLGTE